MANAIDISAPRDKMWYAVYYNKKGIEKAMEDLTGQPSRLGVEGFKSLRSCASTGERADVPNGARGSMYALYFSSADGDYIKDPLGHPVIECVRGQGARSFAPLTLDEPPNDDACSQPACAVMKFGVLYCRC